MRRVLKWLGITLVLAGASAWAGLQLSNSRSYQLAGELITRVETTDSVIAITFDDGPTPIYTDSTLDVLREYDAKATFFMVGERMSQRPEIVRRVLDEGHEIGNHSFNHPAMVLMSHGTVANQIEQTDSVIRSFGQGGDILFRPPYGKRLVSLPLYLREADRATVLWDLEPDSEWRDAAGVVEYVLGRVQPGSILLLHTELPVRRENRAALRMLLPKLVERGYDFVTVSELLTRAGGDS